MNMEIFITVWILLGIASGILTHGMTLAYFWHEFPTLQSTERYNTLVYRQMVTVIASVMCPLVALMLFFFFGCAKHGIMFRNPNR